MVYVISATKEDDCSSEESCQSRQNWDEEHGSVLQSQSQTREELSVSVSVKTFLLLKLLEKKFCSISFFFCFSPAVIYNMIYDNDIQYSSKVCGR